MTSTHCCVVIIYAKELPMVLSTFNSKTTPRVRVHKPTTHTFPHVCPNRSSINHGTSDKRVASSKKGKKGHFPGYQIFLCIKRSLSYIDSKSTILIKFNHWSLSCCSALDIQNMNVEWKNLWHDQFQHTYNTYIHTLEYRTVI